MRLFLCGDVMTGRGIDQILPHPCAPLLFESYVRDARDYVALAEKRNGPIARPADYAYVWGDALDELGRRAPDARIVNLETSVTRSTNAMAGKEIHYRMNPDNVACLGAARLDVCVLANNHVLDWGEAGLVETIETLERAGLRTAGAGRSLQDAAGPAVVPVEGGRVLVLGVGHESSGVPSSWAATANSAGVWLLDDLSERAAAIVGERVRRFRRAGDVSVVSIHWGSNWGYDVPEDHVLFAHALVDAGVDVVHGHSSHHPRPIEIYRGRPIFYGCGDLVTDYEGIGGREEYRGDLALMYFVDLDPERGLLALRMVPMAMRKMRLELAQPGDAAWLADRLAQVSARYRTRIASEGGVLAVAA